MKGLNWKTVEQEDLEGEPKKQTEKVLNMERTMNRELIDCWIKSNYEE